jgi:hypothetical protein
MAREMNSEEAKILKTEEEFYARLENNGLRRIELRYDITSSEFSSQNSNGD